MHRKVQAQGEEKSSRPHHLSPWFPPCLRVGSQSSNFTGQYILLFAYEILSWFFFHSQLKELKKRRDKYVMDKRQSLLTTPNKYLLKIYYAPGTV